MIIEFLHKVWALFLEMSPYLLLGISFVAILDLFVSKSFIAKQVSRNNLGSIVKTAVFGIPLPLCSCGVVPTSVYLEKSGASKPSVVSFLISTPQTGIDSIVATYGMLGPIFAIFRPLAAFVMGIIGGIVTMFFQNSFHNKDTVKDNFQFNEIELIKDGNFLNRAKKSLRYAFVEFVDDISTQFLVGLIIAGAIAYFVPDDFFASYLGNNKALGLLAIILFAIPMYVCATASIPIAVSLMMKGFSPGIAYVFLVAGPVTNAASIVILAKVLGKKLIIIYILTVIILAILFGLLLDWIFIITGINPHTQMSHAHLHSHSASIYSTDFIYGLLFLILLIASYYRKIYGKLKGIKMAENTSTSKIYKIDGMTCNHCVMNVEKAIRNVPGVTNVEVNLSAGVAKVEGNVATEQIKNAIEAIGYKFVGEK